MHPTQCGFHCVNLGLVKLLTLIGLTLIGLTLIGLTLIGLTLIGLTLIGLTLIGLTLIGLTLTRLIKQCQNFVSCLKNANKTFFAGRRMCPAKSYFNHFATQLLPKHRKCQCFNRRWVEVLSQILSDMKQ
nr:hypothetical protein [Ferrovum sp.]